MTHTLRIEDPESQELIQRARAAGQGHIFRFWQQLSEPSRRKLLSQVKQCDFELLATLYRERIRTQDSQPAETAELEPVDILRLPTTPEERAARNRARQLGEAALRAGRVAALLVAGGQGSRLGFDAPKGLFPITPIQKKSFFQLYAEQLLALQNRYGPAIPWYIMTSEATHEPTLAFFEEHRYFGVSPENVVFFQQGMIPALDAHGKVFLDAPDHIFVNPNGHGGVLSALKNSGALHDLRRRNVDTLFYFQVDNPLVRICDPVFLGFHLQARAQISAKVVQKRDPEERVGVFGKRRGRPYVVEYSDLPEAAKYARNPDGSLKFAAGNLAIHLFALDFIEQLVEHGTGLPWHVAHKKIPFLDEAGRVVQPETPNGYKFETFIFDAFPQAQRFVILEVERTQEFSPVKNATGVDSPDTARRDLINLYASWLEQAGVEVPRDERGHVRGHIEISPLFALGPEELNERLSTPVLFRDALYLG